LFISSQSGPSKDWLVQIEVYNPFLLLFIRLEDIISRLETLELQSSLLPFDSICSSETLFYA